VSAKFGPEEAVQTLLDRQRLLGARQIENLAAIVAQPYRYRLAAEGEALDLAQDVSELGARAAHEFAPRRHVVEEIAHLDADTDRMRRGFER
jgi:hypothetical protein